MTSSRHNLSNELNDDQLILFRSQDGSVQLEVELEKETLCLTQKQTAYIFQPERGVVTNHQKSIFSTGELNEESARAHYAHAAEGDKASRAKYCSFMKKAGCASQGWK